MTRQIQKAETFVDAFTKKFGGGEGFWCHTINGDPTTGEGAFLKNGLPVYDPYFDDEMMCTHFQITGKQLKRDPKTAYVFGVNPEVWKWVDAHGWMSSNQDAGTLKFYRN